MENQLTTFNPDEFPGHKSPDDIYAGFGARLGAGLLDMLFVAPMVLLTMYLNTLGKDFYLYTFSPHLLFMMWYDIYLPKRYGGTAGKLALGLKIIRTDGQIISWREAILRHSVLLVLTVINIGIMIFCVLKADGGTFSVLSWQKQTAYLISFAPLNFQLTHWGSNVWFWSEFLVLLTNRKKRAIHDFIAGTVVVKALYLKRPEIQNWENLRQS